MQIDTFRQDYIDIRSFGTIICGVCVCVYVKGRPRNWEDAPSP